MIPKIIHYCWFGGNPLPYLAQKCIESWKKHMPDYEIKEWNESNFDVSLFPFAEGALENKKYAFVSDVCRLYALKHFGGIYMDTDVEVLKTLDVFLKKPAFSGFENEDFVPTGMMASEKGGLWVTELLDYYDQRLFVNSDGSLNTLSNTKIITRMMEERGFVMNNTYQEIEEYVTFYPNDFFCPKSYLTGKIELTENSYCIHHFMQSAISRRNKFRYKLKVLFRILLRK